MSAQDPSAPTHDVVVNATITHRDVTIEKAIALWYQALVDRDKDHKDVPYGYFLNKTGVIRRTRGREQYMGCYEMRELICALDLEESDGQLQIPATVDSSVCAEHFDEHQTDSPL